MSSFACTRGLDNSSNADTNRDSEPDANCDSEPDSEPDAEPGVNDMLMTCYSHPRTFILLGRS
jgi:hypothetical protein